MEQNEDMIALTEALIQRAQDNNHSKFTYIRSWAELLAVKNYKSTIKQVHKQFKHTKKKLYGECVTQLKQGEVDLELVLAVQDCHKVAEFYLDELKIIKDIISEYHSYVMGGHMIDTLLGNYRAEEDLVDYRTLPTKWF